ncbi:MAG: winged helix-turn-helix domain-containing protein, partial [Phycisphaerae bacterium]|nr:winged helix-turn-helix domain-containing protein [Phycisphaerae bacterium]
MDFPGTINVLIDDQQENVMNEPGNSLKPDSRPLYDRAIDAVIRFIEQGDLQSGEKLPAEGAFARQLGISRPTLRQAMGHFESKGVITRRHG